MKRASEKRDNKGTTEVRWRRKMKKELGGGMKSGVGGEGGEAPLSSLRSEYVSDDDGLVL